MVDSRESEQTGRFRWREQHNGYSVHDTETGLYRSMGDGADMFCDANDENCHVPGTQRFYDALNSYFDCEQAEIAEAYFRVVGYVDPRDGRKEGGGKT